MTHCADVSVVLEVVLDLGDRDAQRGEVVGDHEDAQRHRDEGEHGAPVDLPGCAGHARLPVLAPRTPIAERETSGDGFGE